LYLVIVNLLLAGIRLAPPESSAVTLDKTSHFIAPKGSDVLVAAGTQEIGSSH